MQPNVSCVRSKLGYNIAILCIQLVNPLIGGASSAIAVKNGDDYKLYLLSWSS